ncbi:Nicotinamidase [Komagataella phaffii CBS 7435]|uniref:nicotinamidase n=2 Tax=Komagataella phaffii TaxID=460519 RepID=C4R4B7_KOMPG|nr:Nicotinamidase [Komagataella phaffii GS115]AOA63231.1 GQ67_03423T0 [Komagataella phaffii]CAH2449846.1 Nicotinamidase [Komagataella phaffii CBS 7435]AOA69045.1 GQ68_03392T0 [Komagataella phaffii GS115]CAY70403.1 Nicotinamidase [Komagataella phaffii GS115]CCA39807.1 Nicotinamidase [Komagataella phaffii CBS 7435]
MSKSALLIIDLQNDFLEGGSLAVPDGNEIIDPIIELAQKKDWDLVIATKDWHPQDHTSFASNHGVKPYTELEFTNPENEAEKKIQVVWPDHCVQNSNGSEFPPKFKAFWEQFTGPKELVKKGYLSDREYYSAFSDVWKLHKTELDSLLKGHGIRNVTIVGLALDFCVFHTASDALRENYSVTLVTNLTRSVADREGPPSKLQSLGAHLAEYNGSEIIIK